MLWRVLFSLVTFIEITDIFLKVKNIYLLRYLGSMALLHALNHYKHDSNSVHFCFDFLFIWGNQGYLHSNLTRVLGY